MQEALRPLKPADVFWRGLYGIAHEGSQYVVEVDFFDIKEKVRLYRDGVLIGEKRSPASFDIDGACISAAMALYGMKHALLGATAWFVLAVALVTQVPNLLNGVGSLTGWTVPTFGLPPWLDGFLSVAGILAGLDRGLRMKHTPLLDD